VYDVQNPDVGKPDEVDFGIFWNAWRMVNELYVKPTDTDSKTRVYGAIKGMVESLDDPYSTFFTPEQSQDFQESINGRFEGIGAEIGIRDGNPTIIAPLKNSPAERAGLRSGDRILLIDETSAIGMSLEQAVTIIRGNKGTPVVLTVLHDGDTEPSEIRIIRETINIPPMEYTVLKSKDGNIGHLQVYNFNDQLEQEFRRVTKQILSSDVKGLILDVRDNPGGRLDIAISFISWFVDQGDTVVTERGRNPEDEIVHIAQGPAKLKEIPVVVLINEGSASASEILAGALHDLRNVELVGEKTFGKGSVQTYQALPDRSSIKITTALWFTPAGSSINDTGLEPTVAVENVDEEEGAAEVDEQLEKAIEVLEREIGSNK